MAGFCLGFTGEAHSAPSDPIAVDSTTMDRDMERNNGEGKGGHKGKGNTNEARKGFSGAAPK